MSQFRYCPNCGTQNPKDAQECEKCGLIFSKFKPLTLTIENKKQKRSYFLFLLLIIVLFSFLSYITVIVLLEKEFLKSEKRKSETYNLVIRLENIYKKTPVKDKEKKEKYLKEIHSMEKLLSTFPVSEDIEKLNFLEENIRDIKKILINEKEIDDNLKNKIEERFKKLK